MNTSIKRLLLATVMVPAFFLAGCQTAPRLDLQGVQRVERPFDAQVVNVKGVGFREDSWLMAFDPAQAQAKGYGPDLKHAIEKAIQEANLFKPEAATKLSIEARIYNVQSMGGWSEKVLVELQYMITDTTNNKVIFNRLIQTKEGSEGGIFGGDTTASLQNSLRKNVALFISGLQRLSQEKNLPNYIEQ